MKRIFSLCLIILFGISLVGCGKNKEVSISFPEKIQSLDSYKLSGKLYTTFPSGTKECLITTYYQKPNLYRVEIDNPNMNDKQIILKNDNGVHVLIPSLNKTFMVKSAWPSNSSYPYILESLASDILKDDNKVESTSNDTKIIELSAKMHENALPSTQKVIFDEKTMNLKEVQVYDENKNLVTRFVVTEYEENKKLENSLFNATETLVSVSKIYQDASSNFVREITYPTYFPENTKLEDELRTGTTSNMRSVIVYSGDTPYTIIESYAFLNETASTSYLTGSVVVMAENIYVVDTNSVFFYSQGMEYVVASNYLSQLEMMKIGESLLVSSEK